MSSRRSLAATKRKSSSGKGTDRRASAPATASSRAPAPAGSSSRQRKRAGSGRQARPSSHSSSDDEAAVGAAAAAAAASATGPADEIDTFEDAVQLFGFSPVDVVDQGWREKQLRDAAVINAVNHYLFDGADEMYALLSDETRYKQERDPTLLRDDMNRYLKFAQDAVDKYFDMFELYTLRNVFSIPEDVSVPGDYPDHAESEEKLRGDIEKLRAKLRMSLGSNLALRKELADLQSINGKSKTITEINATFKSTCKKARKPLLHESIDFVCQQHSELLLACEGVVKEVNNNPGSKRDSSATGSPAKKARGSFKGLAARL